MEIESTKAAEIEKADYLSKLKAYHAMGIKVLIDGRELPEKDWDGIFRVAESRDDGSSSCYMADFVAAPSGVISEIRLDKVFVEKM